MIIKKLILIFVCSVFVFSGCTSKNTNKTSSLINTDNIKKVDKLANSKNSDKKYVGIKMEDDQIVNLILTADSLKERIEIKPGNTKIGTSDGSSIFGIEGEFSNFSRVQELMGKYFSDEMIELELHDLCLINIYGKIGRNPNANENEWYINQTSKYKIYKDTDNIKQIEFETFNQSHKSSRREYILEPNEDRDWKITNRTEETNKSIVKNKEKRYLRWTEVDASSAFPANNEENFNEENVIDGDVQTGWCEGQPDSGIGEWIMLKNDAENDVFEIELTNGYTKSKEDYTNSNRVKRLKFEFSDGYSKEIQLRDYCLDYQKFTLDKNVKTSFIKITVLEVYKGSKYDDTIISDVKVF